MSRVLVTGVSGQDGAWLAQRLLADGHEVWGGFRRSSRDEVSRLDALGLADRIHPVAVEMCEDANLLRTLRRIQPDAIYNLAAQSFVATSFDQPVYTGQVNALGVARLLEAVREVCPETRLYQASTSEMFGIAGTEGLLDEHSPFRPRSPYAVAKVYAHHLVANYRDAYGLFACSGILFNHESPLRGPEFVTRKITRAVAAIARGQQDHVALGALDAARDWGWAPEYVDAMVRMVEADHPADYVVATGVAHTVRDFARVAFAAVDVELAFEGDGLDEVGRCTRTGAVRVRVDPRWFRPSDVPVLRGDASRARQHLGWQPQVDFPTLVERMVHADLARIDGDPRGGLS